MKSLSHLSLAAMVIVTLVMAVLFLPCPAFAGEEESLYVQGNAFCMQGQWDRAIESFSALLAKYPGTRFVDAQFWVGYCNAEKGNYTQAIEKFRNFAEKYPQNNYSSQALYKIGEIYEKNLSDYKKAIEAYNNVEKRFPASNVAVQSAYSRSYLNEFVEMNFGQAQQGYEKVARLVSERKDVYSGYKERAQQRIAFINANSDFGYKPLKIYNQAVAYEEHGKTDKAFEGYTAVVTGYPRSSLANHAAYRIVRYWEKKGVVAKVREEGRRFMSLYPQSEYAPQVRTILQKYGE